MPSARHPFLIILTLANIGLINLTHANAQLPPPRVYQPLPIILGETVKDKLSNQDIPTGDGGFARDYFVNLKEKDRILIEVTSDQFDTIVILMTESGETVAENDDAPDGSTNSLLFATITTKGKYIIRVRSFALTGGGDYTIRVAKMQEIP